MPWDRIRNEFIRGTAKVRRLGDKLRETRLRWYGHVRRRGEDYIGRRILRMGLPGMRKRKDQGEGIKMQLEEIWRRWGLRRKRLRTGKDGDVKSAVATPKGSSRKTKILLLTDNSGHNQMFASNFCVSQRRQLLTVLFLPVGSWSTVF